MCRAMFSFEVSDPDFSWLISTFQEENPDCFCVESGCLPVVLLPQFTNQNIYTDEIKNEEELFFNEILGGEKKEVVTKEDTK